MKLRHQTHRTELQAVLDLLHFTQPLLDHLLELFHGLFNLDLIQLILDLLIADFIQELVFCVLR